MNILKQVTFESARRKKDKSISLNFVTSLEQSPAEFMAMDELLNDMGVLMFKSNGDLTAEEIDAINNVEIENEGKTKSQRLRGVLFLLARQEGEDHNFNDYYSRTMEKIIEHFKGKLKDQEL